MSYDLSKFQTFLKCTMSTTGQPSELIISCQLLNAVSELLRKKIPREPAMTLASRRVREGGRGAALMCMKQSGINVLLISSSLLYEDAHQRQPRAWVHT